MGKQSARIAKVVNGEIKDHKDIVHNGYYHEAVYHGNELVWQKLYSKINYSGEYGTYSTPEPVNYMVCDNKTLYYLSENLNIYKASMNNSLDKPISRWNKLPVNPIPDERKFVHIDSIGIISKAKIEKNTSGSLIWQNGIFFVRYPYLQVQIDRASSYSKINIYYKYKYSYDCVNWHDVNSIQCGLINQTTDENNLFYEERFDDQGYPVINDSKMINVTRFYCFSSSDIWYSNNGTWFRGRINNYVQKTFTPGGSFTKYNNRYYCTIYISPEEKLVCYENSSPNASYTIIDIVSSSREFALKVIDGVLYCGNNRKLNIIDITNIKPTLSFYDEGDFYVDNKHYLAHYYVITDIFNGTQVATGNVYMQNPLFAFADRFGIIRLVYNYSEIISFKPISKEV